MGTSEKHIPKFPALVVVPRRIVFVMVTRTIRFGHARSSPLGTVVKQKSRARLRVGSFIYRIERADSQKKTPPETYGFRGRNQLCLFRSTEEVEDTRPATVTGTEDADFDIARPCAKQVFENLVHVSGRIFAEELLFEIFRKPVFAKLSEGTVLAEERLEEVLGAVVGVADHPVSIDFNALLRLLQVGIEDLEVECYTVEEICGTRNDVD